MVLLVVPIGYEKAKGLGSNEFPQKRKLVMCHVLVTGSPGGRTVSELT